ncbi:MAG TPA: winged helix-turn-helix domain-containing protein [Candidatus Acidoferrum sp.]|nr:winged helix-turn-helix domain-containing protein [Candidatus Acidoferrum sp.]
MALPASNSKPVRFGLYELDVDARELRKGGVRIKLQEQPFQVLVMLLDRPGTVVTREELHKKLWPEGTFVDFDLNLNSAVKKLRQALNDDSENPRFVETLHRRGYRFIAPVNGAANSDEIRLVEGGPVSPALAEPIPIEASRPTSTRRRHLVLLGITLLLSLVAAAAYWLVPARLPTVLGYTQITHDGLLKTGLVTDGQRLYFQELQGDHFVISQVSVAGGETSVVPTPFQNVMGADIAPNGSALLVGTFQGTGKRAELWSLPLPSGAPRRLGDYVIDSATWSPEGSQLAFSRGPDIYLAKSDGSESHKLASVGSQVYGLAFSPDGRRLRFSVVDRRNGSSEFWEIRRDGTGLHPLLPGWNPNPRQCCGNWTPDGKYFLFEDFRDGRTSLWALAEKSTWLGREAKPVQLTNGPLHFGSPVASKDGKRIFAVGAQPRCELVRYDGKSSFVPFLDSISASELAFSSDGKWVAYVTVPEHQLWRSKLDGSERGQLTFEAMEASLPKWSPDGKQIVFMGATLKTGWRAYVISSDGTALRELIPGAEAGFDPGWSPDGKSIVLTLNDAGSSAAASEGPGIVTVDVATSKVSPVPGAKQLFSPRWSPDGRYIAAITDDSGKLMLFDRINQQWHELVSMPMGYPTWSHDGQYIYFDTTLTEDANFFRLRISDHKLERLVSLKGLRQYWDNFGSWTGLTPDDSPLLVRDTSNQEIYALDWQAP